MNVTTRLDAPLLFNPVYQTLVWGGRRIAALRAGVPSGPIGEAWDLAHHSRADSVVADGPLAGRTLGQLVAADPEGLVGDGFRGTTFPLLVKLIDATDRLSVQVHPDDALAVALGVGEHGKTECWYPAAPGGSLYVGTASGVTRESFEEALGRGQIAGVLHELPCPTERFVFVPARTVHAIGAGCLLWEVQQSSDITFRVDDWGRKGLDGKPRPLHVAESLRTIDFLMRPVVPSERVDCDYFDAFRVSLGSFEHEGGRCAIVITLDEPATMRWSEGQRQLAPMSVALLPASLRRATVITPEAGLLVARPRW